MSDRSLTGPYQPPTVDEDAAATPQHIGRYRVERVLGKGGFGLVYLAHDDQLQRLVAIKVPHHPLISTPGDAQAYLTEARTVANLDHPNIVIWMSSIECQLAQGCVGDLIMIRGKDDKGEMIPVCVRSEVAPGPDKKPRWKKGGEPTVFTNCQLWWSQHDPDFKELLDTRRENDVESPLGQWTRVECVCEGKRLQILVNGSVVNECYDVFPSAGQILLEVEGFEIFFRKFELHPLTKADKSR